MTDYTLRILKHPDGASSDDLEDPYRQFEVVQDLAYYARSFGPYRLQTWAEANDAPLFYIDNCSVRAVASGAQIRKLAGVELKGAVIDDSVVSTSTYILAASEF